MGEGGEMKGNIVEWVTCTLSADKPDYIFEVAINAREIDKMQHETFLGLFVYKKDKWRFLNELRERIADEVLEQLRKANQRWEE
jgi:hypothetical protein